MDDRDSSAPPRESPHDRAWAGRVVFPRSDADLRSTTQCPACLTPLRSAVCSACGLDLRHPSSAVLASVSAQIADALDARLDLIGRIRRETAAPSSATSTSTVSGTAGDPLSATRPVAQAAPGAGRSEPARGRRSGIQIALIVVGVSLLSVFAVFGLVYAFVTYGSTVRMLIIAAGTVATLVAAGVVARRGLSATAEGVAALGSVVLVLDAWALRLNDPDGLGASADRLYWGIALLAVGAIVALWSRWGALAVPTVAGAAILPVGAGLLTAHLLEAAPPGSSTTGGAIAAIAVAALSWFVIDARRTTARIVGRVIAQTTGALAGMTALFSIVGLAPGSRYAPVIAGLLIAVATAAHVMTMHLAAIRTGATLGARHSALDAIIAALLSTGVVVAALAGTVVTSVRIDQDRVTVSVPLIAATALAVAAEQGWRRTGISSMARTAFATSTLVAGALAAVAGGLAAVVGISAFVESSTVGLKPVPIDVDDRVASAEPATIFALAALGLATGLVALGWALLARLIRRGRAVTPILAIVVVVAVPLIGPWWSVMIIFALLALGGAIALRFAVRVADTDARRALTALLAPLTSGAALGAFATSWAVAGQWPLGLVVALSAIGIARPTTPSLVVRAAGLSIAAALTIGSMPALADDLGALGDDAGSAAFIILAAALIMTSASLGRLSTIERVTVGAVAIAGGALASIIPGSPPLPQVAALAALAGALALVAGRGSLAERIGARALLPLVVARAAELLARGLGSDEALISTVSIGSLVVVVTLGLLAVSRPSTGSLDGAIGRERLLRALGDATAALAALLALALTPASDLLWLPVLITGVVALAVAIDVDGLVGSRSPRRHLGWVALGFATAALWLRLVDARVSDPEGFVLPLAGALAALAAANAFLPQARVDASPRTVPLLTFTALIVALVPLSLASIYGGGLRGAVVAIIGVALVLGAIGLAARVDAALPGTSSALIASGLSALGALGIAQTIDLARAADGAALVGLDLLRAALVVIVLTAVSLGSWVLGPGQIPVAVRQGAVASMMGIAALSAGALGLVGAVDPIELVSLPLALGMIAIGSLRLDSHPAARSWPWLGPGFGALLIPSLLAIDGAGEPLWRAVALGISAACVFVIALWRRLQAPFVIGGGVLLAHLLVQSWPLLEQVGRAVEWWLWLGLSGVLVVVIAARYERRVQNVRDVATRIAHLR